jgi:uncharacterized Ntn-hydrolase superfamily protein
MKTGVSHIVGHHFAVQANLMRTDAVWPAMARAFESATGDLAERMLVALEAAKEAGGDIRGRQSPPHAGRSCLQSSHRR